MRKAMILLAVFCLTGSLMAANPWEGAWRLNMAKSKLHGIYGDLKEMTLTMRELSPDESEWTATGVQTNGSPFSAKYTMPLPGGIRKYQQAQPEGITFVDIFIDLNDAYTVVLQNGKQIGVTHWILSKDGKTFQGTWKATDAKGQPYEGLSLWEKQ
jgi:hypothetical protein